MPEALGLKFPQTRFYAANPLNNTEMPKNKIALHVHSIQILVEFGKHHPELISEFRQTIDFNARNKSAAYTIARRNFNPSFPE